MRCTRAIIMPALAVTDTFALSACASDSVEPDGSGAATQEESPGSFNDADVEFTTGMVPHHQQGVAMSEMAQERGGHVMADLADLIEAAQGSEIEHHEGAITMAQVEQNEGVNPEAIDLAGTIIDAQQAEIVEVEKMLDFDQ